VYRCTYRWTGIRTQVNVGVQVYSQTVQDAYVVVVHSQVYTGVRRCTGVLTDRAGRVRGGILGDRPVVVRVRAVLSGGHQATSQDACTHHHHHHHVLCCCVGRQQTGPSAQSRRLRVRSAQRHRIDKYLDTRPHVHVQTNTNLLEPDLNDSETPVSRTVYLISVADS